MTVPALGKKKFWKTITVGGHDCSIYKVENLCHVEREWGQFHGMGDRSEILIDASLKGKWLTNTIWHETFHFLEHIYAWDLREDRVAVLGASMVELTSQLSSLNIPKSRR